MFREKIYCFFFKCINIILTSISGHTIKTCENKAFLGVGPGGTCLQTPECVAARTRK